MRKNNNLSLFYFILRCTDINHHNNDVTFLNTSSALKNSYFVRLIPSFSMTHSDSLIPDNSYVLVHLSREIKSNLTVKRYMKIKRIIKDQALTI